MAPDLIAEFRSPDDRPGEVNAKIADWLAAGVKLAWVLDPDQRSAVVHRPDGTTTAVGADDELDGETVLPGFRCSLKDLYR